MTELPLDDFIPEWTLGWRMRRALEYAGISVDEMADWLEVERKTVSRYTHDKTRPQASTLRDWARRCGVSYQWLRDGTVSGGGGPMKSTVTKVATRNVSPALHVAKRRNTLLTAA